MIVRHVQTTRTFPSGPELDQAHRILLNFLDSAGQAFCSALSNTICYTNPCSTCPNRPSPLSREMQVTPAREAVEMIEGTAANLALHRRHSSARDEVPEAMVACSDACAY